MNARMLAALFAGMWLATAGIAAHHGTLINYDRSKQWTAKAVVREFKYVNPHAQLFFDVTDDSGKVTHWSGELLPNPAQLIRNGWTKKRSVEALRYGTPIVVTVVPSRKGGDVALVLKIENEKGEELLGAPVPAR
ncbi:MAG TPA: DUF6152 family protein [Vicinamibacterales bacterium]|nr:DUF6152 family protein [Vicinamibacterales bacterium]